MSDEDETLKVLKAPVHLVVLQPSHIQKLQAKGTFPVGGLVRPIPEPHELPGVPKPVRVPRHNPLARFKPPHVNSVKDRMKKTRLAVLHDRVLPIPDHLKPPCGTCKTSACCKAFVVGITKEEYDSGLYTPYAVALDSKYMKQLQGKLLLPITATAPVRGTEGIDYYLEGRIGEDCPFLAENGDCGIYDQRPITCRVYSCVEDDRITDEMRESLTYD